MITRVLVGGGTGFLGTALRNALRQEGYEVTVLSRSLPRNESNTKDRFITFKEIENNGLPQFDAIIHLR
jgi:nucleoside-diphosphate-sugar epimerase